MQESVLNALNRFDESVQLEDYNMFSASECGELNAHERNLAISLASTDMMVENQIGAVRERVDFDLGAKLIAFSLRMASAAIRVRSAEFIKAGAVALTLDKDQLDERDVYVALAVLYHAGTRLCLAVDEIIQAAAVQATPRRRSAIESGFLGGPGYMKCIRSMGVELQESSDGVIYKVSMS